ncbi:MAG: hypothetical protein H7138_27955, partial [Myxococcales bacterium]|nr:hypothetical protein [Myxococcales bacterium]
HARTVIRDEVARGLDLMVLGGGDGTIVMGLALIDEACRGAGRAEPAIGVLRLGSGNAFADAVGASRDVVSDLARLVAGEGTWRKQPLIEVMGLRAPFVGLGLDAQLLEDHHIVGRRLDLVPGARRFLGGGARYVLSVGLRSIPRFARDNRARAVVINLGAPAMEMAKGGATGREVAAGEVLWRGPCTLIAGGTIPFFGFGLRMFAFSHVRRDRFHLRCGDGTLLEILRHVPAAFRGEYFSEHTRDFLCERIAVELDAESPVEAGGELLASQRRVEIGLGAPMTIVALGTAER